MAAIKITEDMKETLLKAKGQDSFIVIQIINSEWHIVPKIFSKITEEKDKVILNEYQPLEEPKEVKDGLIRSIMPKLRKNLRADIAKAVKHALEEKSIKQLKEIDKTAKDAKLKRTKGCFWLTTPSEEILL